MLRIKGTEQHGTSIMCLSRVHIHACV